MYHMYSYREVRHIYAFFASTSIFCVIDCQGCCKFFAFVYALYFITNLWVQIPPFVLTKPVQRKPTLVVYTVRKPLGIPWAPLPQTPITCIGVSWNMVG